MKKIFIFFLILTVLCATFSGCRVEVTPEPETEPEQEADAPVEEPVPDYDYTVNADLPTEEITVGINSRIGSLFHVLFPGGNSAAGHDIWRLTRGLRTYEWTIDEVYTLNPTVVKNESISVNADGAKTYLFEIHDDLFFSDGTPITAEHYVFGILLYNSQEFGRLGASNTQNMELAGWEAYSSGDSKSFAGVRLYDSYSYSVTISSEYSPFYYETHAVSASPIPMHAYAEGVRVVDSEDGAMLSDEFTEDLIRISITDDSEGLIYYPRVFSGAYMMTSYDPEAVAVVFDYNPFFKGNYDGSTPNIARITLLETLDLTGTDLLTEGAVQLLHGVGADVAEVGFDLAQSPDRGIHYQEYPRAGYGKIHFRHDFGPTRFQSVRQAIAHSLDRDELVKQISRGSGVVIHGFYSTSTREYDDNADELYDLLDLYPFSVDKAAEILAEDGWIYNEDGRRYAEDSGLPRYKRVHGMLEPLVIQWFSTESSPVSALIADLLIPEAAKAGIIIEETKGGLSTLLQQMNSHETEFHMFNFSAGFTPTSYKWLYYGTEDGFMGTYNNNFIRDSELESLAHDMKSTPTGNFDAWSRKWLNLQARWNYILPDIPLYSELLYDFFPANLQNYSVTPLWGWAYAIQYASFEGLH